MSVGVAFESGPHALLFLPIKRGGDETHIRFLDRVPARSGPPKSFIGELPDNVTHHSVFDKGGHFPAIEEPELLVGDLRKFFRPLRSE